MGGCLGALMLLPYGIAVLLAKKIVESCAKKGGLVRLLGVLACLILGGFCVGLGYWGAFEGYTEWRGLELYQVTYPVWGWIGIVVGGSIIVFFSLRSLIASKQEIELEEQEEKIKKEMKEEAWRAVKVMAREMLAQEKIENMEKFNQIIQILEKEPLDREASDLASQLKKLKKTQKKLLE